MKNTLKISVPVLWCLLLFSSCGRVQRTEKEDVSFWNRRVVDSSFALLYKDSDTTRALRYFDSVLLKSPGITVYPIASRFALKANYHYFFTSDNKSTAEMIDSALAIYHSADLHNQYPRTYVGLLLFGGHIAYRLTQYNKANEYYFRAEKMGDKHLDPCERAAFHYNIAMVLYRQRNYNESLNYFNEAYNLQNSCSPQTAAIILQQQEIQSNIGLCYLQLKNYDSAMLQFGKALEIAEFYRDTLGQVTMERIHGVIYGHKGKVALEKNNLDTAQQLCLQSIALCDREGYEQGFAQAVKLQLAEVYKKKNDAASMLAILKDVDSSILESNARLLMEWSGLMASYYEQTAQPTKALQLFRQNYLLRDSLANSQMILSAADVTRQLHDKEQQLQIASLKKDKELAMVSLWVIIIFTCMVMVIIFLIYQNYKRSKKSLAISLALNEEIRKQKAAREEEEHQRHKLITEAVIRAQENERSVISLELHDNINQVLTTVKLHNEMVIEGMGDAKVVLPKTIKYLQECINEIRSLSRRLSAPSLGKITLEESINELVDSINETSKVRISRNIIGLHSVILKQDLHLGVYRILQEQLNNVLKHSSATEVWVEVEKVGNSIRLLVKDNGKGFQLNNTKAGIGLMNMQTRAENLNGTFSLESQPGKGCVVEVVLPV